MYLKTTKKQLELLFYVVLILFVDARISFDLT